MNRTCTECPAIIPASADPRKLVCSTKCANARRARLHAEHVATLPMPGGRKQENHMRVTEVAMLNGVQPNAIRSWLKHNKHPSVKWRGQRWVHKRTAELYAQQRAARAGRVFPRKPRGWLNLKQLCDLLGVGGDAARKHLRENPDIRTGKVGTWWVIHPDDAEVLRQRLRSDDPLPGWIALSDLASELGRRLTTLHIVVDRLGIETKFAARAGTRAARHVTPSGAEALRAWSAKAERVKFKRRRPRRGVGLEKTL